MVKFRAARESDAERLAQINLPYVRDTAITFMYEQPTAESFVQKIRHTTTHYPFLVAEVDGQVMGYAYASALRVQEAYQWAVELTIYLDPACQHMGLGTALYTRLLRLLTIQGFLSAYSCITLPNEKSIGLHEKFGFEQVGLFPESGYKLGKWHSVVWLRKALGECTDLPIPPTPYARFDPAEVETLLL